MAGERWAGVGYNYEITWLSSSTLTYIADIKSQRQSLNTIKVFIVVEFHPLEVFHIQVIFRQHWVSLNVILFLYFYLICELCTFSAKLYLLPLQCICSVTMPIFSHPILV